MDESGASARTEWFLVQPSKFKTSSPSLRGQGCGQGAFELQQFALYLESAAVATQGSVGRDHPVAGNDDRNRVAVVGQSHRAKALRPSHRPSYVGVGPGFAVRDFEQGFPTGELKLRAAEIEPELELATSPGEVFFQFPYVRPQLVLGALPAQPLAGRIRMTPVPADGLLSRQTPVKLERDQPGARRGQEQGSDGRKKSRVLKGFHG